MDVAVVKSIVEQEEEGLALQTAGMLHYRGVYGIPTIFDPSMAGETKHGSRGTCRSIKMVGYFENAGNMSDNLHLDITSMDRRNL